MCFDHYAFDVTPVPPDWKEVVISFDMLKQGGFGKPVMKDLTHVLSMNFSVRANTQFDVWLDQLQFL